jgi:hypothetical protein
MFKLTLKDILVLLGAPKMLYRVMRTRYLVGRIEHHEKRRRRCTSALGVILGDETMVKTAYADHSFFFFFTKPRVHVKDTPQYILEGRYVSSAIELAAITKEIEKRATILYHASIDEIRKSVQEEGMKRLFALSNFRYAGAKSGGSYIH